MKGEKSDDTLRFKKSFTHYLHMYKQTLCERIFPAGRIELGSKGAEFRVVQGKRHFSCAVLI